MSTLKVDTILKRSGTGTITLGQSGDTISIPSGATITNSGTNGGANNTVHLIKDAPVPSGSSLELLAGNKIVLEDTDEITLTASGASDITISIMEIT